MDWNALKIFSAVAQDRSLMAAAATLGMSHSTVYRRLNDLEEQVGRLFERLNGRYELTELGEEMFVHAQAITHSFDSIDRHIAGKDEKLKGVVRITAPSSFAYNYLPRHLIEFKTLYPGIQLELLVTNLELNMSHRHADIAIRVTDSPPEHLVGREVCRIKWGVYASENYLAAHGWPGRLEDIAYHNLVGATGILRNHPVFLWLDKEHGARVGLRTDDLVAMACFARDGLGLALLPDDLSQPGLTRLFTWEPGGENQLWVLTHPDLRKVERIKIVMRFLATKLADT